MKPPITPTLGQTSPERWPGPSSANQTGQARSTSAEAQPDGQRLGGMGGPPPQPGRVGHQRGDHQGDQRR